MTQVSQTRKADQPVEELELNRETVQDLTERETEAVKGGVVARPDAYLLPTTSLACRQ